MVQITPCGSNKLVSPGLNTRSARTKTTTATLAATPIIALSSHSYVRAVPIRISPTRTDGTSLLGSRAWVNPFTGFFLSNPDPTNHTGHQHDGVSHRIRVNVSDLNTTLNQGATYFAEAQYLTPQEYAWCQTHPGQCNMYNNASYRKFLVSGTTNFTFSPVGQTGRMQPAITAWTGATVNQVEPDPGNDGIWFMGYKVTNPTPGVYHYEYAAVQPKSRSQHSIL